MFYINSYDLLKGIIQGPKIISDFYVKQMVDISCGECHWLVLEREDVKPLEKWTEADVMQWFKEMKMEEFMNIIKYEKINGKDILNGDETFFVNVMGMPDDQIKKIKYEINVVKYASCKKTKLWGWGSNKQGQLGDSYSTPFLKSPTLINLPEMKNENDYVVKVFCGKTFSLLFTKYGEIFITGNYDIKEASITNTTITPVSNNTSVNKKNRVGGFLKHKNSTPKPTQTRWVNITKEICFDSLNEETLKYIIIIIFLANTFSKLKKYY